LNRLKSLGWSPYFERQVDRAAESHLSIARVAEEQRGHYRVLAEAGEWRAELSGRFRHDAAATGAGAAYPAVGDWVLVHLPGPTPEHGAARIERLLERRTKFSRKEAGNRSAEQVIASNIDTVFLVQSLNRDLNLRRLERYLALLWESGAEPVVVLSKADLCPDREAAVAEVEAVAHGVSVLVLSAVTGEGLEEVGRYLGEGATVALVGSSGVGKSTLVNALLGEERMAVRDIRDDDRGRHTTTSRHLILLPGGGILIDTPGMRTVILWEGEEGIETTFGDIEALAASCRFTDCTHDTEPGCAVQAALADGTLEAARYRSYQKLLREAQRQARKTDVHLRREEQRRWRRLYMEYRRRPDKRRV
jgi:ribosome biogenesis GTPase